MFTIKKIDHLGIAVKNLSETLKFYEETLGLKITKTEIVEDQKVKVAFIPVGETNLEIMESTSPDGTVAKFIDKNGEGLHHVALNVDNIDNALKAMKEKNVRLIDQEPRLGAGGARIAFIHPKETKGVLLELSEHH